MAINILQISASFDWSSLAEGLDSAVLATRGATEQMAESFERLRDRCSSAAQQVSDLLGNVNSELKSAVSGVEQADPAAALARQLETLTRFRDQHPEVIWIDINTAIDNVNVALAELASRQQRVLQEALTAAGNKNLQSLFQIPTSPVTGPTDSAAVDKKQLEVSGKYDPALAYKAQGKQLQEWNKAGYVTGPARPAMEKEYLDQLNRGFDENLMKTGKAMAGIKVFFRQYIQDANDWAKQTKNLATSVCKGIDDALNAAMKDIVNGTKTVGQAFAKMGLDIVVSVAQASAQMLVHFITANVIMRGISKLFHLDLQTSKQAESAAAAKSNTAQAISAAFLGAANAYAFWAWDPPTAAAVAATALGTGLAFAALAGAAGWAGTASAAGGWERVPRDQFAFVHKNEMVLPSTFAGKLRNVIDGLSDASPHFSRGAPALALAPAGPSINVHTSYNHNTMDPRTSRELMQAHGDIIGDIAIRKFKRWMKDNGLRWR